VLFLLAGCSLVGRRVLVSLINELPACCFLREEVLSQFYLSCVTLANGLEDPSYNMGFFSAEKAEKPNSTFYYRAWSQIVPRPALI
jgi:hypothetical protein